MQEIEANDMNSVLLAEALNLRFQAQHKHIYPTAEDIVSEVLNG